jgi:hypothetical protein
MEKRQIKINGHSEVETLKIYILQKLKIIDHKKNNLQEFESRLKDYLGRNKNLRLEFILDNAQFEKDISFDLNLSNIQTQQYPENYEFGNPLNRWFDSGTPLTQEESEIKDLNTKHQINDRIEKFNLFFERIEFLGNGQIKIERK